MAEEAVSPKKPKDDRTLCLRENEMSSFHWVIPDGITKIRIRSLRDGKEVLDREIKVTPGQEFIITNPTKKD